MEAATKVKLLSLKPYRHLFPEARVMDITVEKYAGVSHTVLFIPQVVKQCAWMVKDFVKQELEGLSRYEACKKLWHFVKYHIEYVPDKKTKEQVRSPRRVIHDAKGDCDCMTTFVDTCLYVLGVRGIINRITAYEAGHFQHIYSLIPDGKGKFIIMDCVVDQFNYEKPYTKKKDYTMELQFLDGIEEKRVSPFTTDLREVFDNRAALGDIGRILKRAAQRNSGGARKPLFKKPVIKVPAFRAPIIPKRSPAKKAAAKEKRKNFGKKIVKAVNKVNKINPATVLLRAGILASMKLNVLKIAERIKWGYASPELAQSMGMDMSKYGKIKSVLAKTEQIFFAAGGKPENLKKAILTGNGNRNREVAGLGELADTLRLSELLGSIYADEFINGMDGFEGFDGFEGIDGLGEPATATSLAAASTAMGALAALLKSIGDLFPNKGKKAAAPAPSPEPEPQAEQETQTSTSEAAPTQQEPSQETEQEQQETPEEESPASEEQSEETPSEETPSEETPTEEQTSEESVEGILSGVGSAIGSFYQNNKKLIIGLGIGAAAITTALVINHYASREAQKEKPRPSENEPLYSLNGNEKKKRGRKKGSKNKKPEPEMNEIIELM